MNYFHKKPKPISVVVKYLQTISVYISGYTLKLSHGETLSPDMGEEDPITR